MNSQARFNVVPAGRRSGKTERAKRKLVRIALSCVSEFEDPRYFAAAPTRQQAKDIWWLHLKQLSPRETIVDISESELRIKYITGASITVVGMDKPERIEGQPWDGGVLDEFANMKSHAWDANIRPALSDRKGWCDLIGVPEGRNHYYELFEQALNDGKEWRAFTWPSKDILPEHEVESAKSRMDPLIFQQEYEASFVNFAGRIYHCFDSMVHRCPTLEYNPKLPLVFCFDFNVAPGVAAICQEFPELPTPGKLPGTAVIGQVHIPQGSNTKFVCNKLINDWGKHPGKVYCYGDATGGAPGSAKTEGSDWDIIRRMLRPVFQDRLLIMVPDGNPAERARVNAVNNRLLNAAGEVRMLVNPVKAPAVVKDFEGVRCVEGGSGEIDKESDKKLTHISDALGYYIHYKFPVITGAAPRDITI